VRVCVYTHTHTHTRTHAHAHTHTHTRARTHGTYDLGSTLAAIDRYNYYEN